MPFNLGIGEVLVVLVVALLVFGKRLPEVGRSLGRGIVEFKEGLKGAAASLKESGESKGELDAAPEETLPADAAVEGCEVPTEDSAEGEAEKEALPQEPS